jgi:hypothetical protein
MKSNVWQHRNNNASGENNQRRRSNLSGGVKAKIIMAYLQRNRKSINNGENGVAASWLKSI